MTSLVSSKVLNERVERLTNMMYMINRVWAKLAPHLLVTGHTSQDNSCLILWDLILNALKVIKPVDISLIPPKTRGCEKRSLSKRLAHQKLTSLNHTLAEESHSLWYTHRRALKIHDLWRIPLNTWLLLILFSLHN